MQHRTPLPVIACLLTALSVAACSTPNVGTDVAVTGMPNAEVALRDSMHVVDAEMGKLGVLAPITRSSGPVVPGELLKTVAFNFSGSLEDGVRQLARSVGYGVAVSPLPTGQVPVQVAVSTGSVELIQAFQALGDAAGSRAMVTVDPVHRQVDVAYRA